MKSYTFRLLEVITDSPESKELLKLDHKNDEFCISFFVFNFPFNCWIL